MKNVSIIIPLGPDEDQLSQLLDDLTIVPEDREIILASCEAGVKYDKRFRLIKSEQGRAIQQNSGAEAAQGKYLWFLHADSRITPQVLDALDASLQAAPDALHYFHLKFSNDGPRAMGLNEWGAWFRSRILGLPFGDQGFCLSKDNFIKIGGFPEQAAYGEDHLLVWRARQAGIKLCCTGTALQTSARKYSQYGHGRLMVKYQWLWIKQAAPEFLKLIRLRFKNLIGSNRE